MYIIKIFPLLSILGGDYKVRKVLICIFVLFFCFNVVACSHQQRYDSNNDINNQNSQVDDITNNTTDKSSDINLQDDVQQTPDINDVIDKDNIIDITSLSVAEKRDKKVVINFENHYSTDFQGYIAKNKDNNMCIAYAPNYYNYFVYIKCSATTDDVWNQVTLIIDNYFSGILDEGGTIVDAIILSENEVMMIFPDFESFSLCQEELLNKLSELNSTEQIVIDYFNAQNETKIIENRYVYINLGEMFYENIFIRNYEEFTKILSDYFNHVNNNVELQKITEKTFEENYIFVINNNCYDKFEISDAQLIGDRVYFTVNRYVANGEAHDMIARHNSCVTIVPKSEIESLNDQMKIQVIYANIYTE